VIPLLIMAALAGLFFAPLFTIGALLLLLLIMVGLSD
jgi:hypothetical protein